MDSQATNFSREFAGILQEETRRAVSEAIATYVGHRVEVFAMAAQELRDGVRTVEEIAETYNKGMQRVGFGYYDSNGDQVYSKTGTLPQELKDLVDTRILEGKIGDTFEQTPALAPADEKSAAE